MSAALKPVNQSLCLLCAFPHRIGKLKTGQILLFEEVTYRTASIDAVCGWSGCEGWNLANLHFFGLKLCWWRYLAILRVFLDNYCFGGAAEVGTRWISGYCGPLMPLQHSRTCLRQQQRSGDFGGFWEKPRLCLAASTAVEWKRRYRIRGEQDSWSFYRAGRHRQRGHLNDPQIIVLL